MAGVMRQRQRADRRRRHQQTSAAPHKRLQKPTKVDETPAEADDGRPAADDRADRSGRREQTTGADDGSDRGEDTRQTHRRTDTDTADGPTARTERRPDGARPRNATAHRGTPPASTGRRAARPGGRALPRPPGPGREAGSGADRVDSGAPRSAVDRPRAARASTGGRRRVAREPLGTATTATAPGCHRSRKRAFRRSPFRRPRGYWREPDRGR